MSYENRIKARIQANRNRIKIKELEIEKTKGEIGELINANEYLSEMLEAEKKDNKNN